MMPTCSSLCSVIRKFERFERALSSFGRTRVLQARERSSNLLGSTIAASRAGGAPHKGDRWGSRSPRCNHSTDAIRWTDAQLINAVKTHSSLAAAIRSLGLRSAGSNSKLIKSHVIRLGLNTSHFRMNTSGLIRRQALTVDQIFREHSPVVSTKLRVHVLKHNLIPYVCRECRNAGTHNGKPLTLQLDHINGVHDDARVDNLRFLCPNCHTQTPTYARRKSTEHRHSQRQTVEVPCDECGAIVVRRKSQHRHLKQNGSRTLCLQCNRDKPFQRKADWNLVVAEFKITGSCQGTGRKFGISGTTVKKIIERFGVSSNGRT